MTEWQGYERVAGPLGGERADQLATLTAFYVTKALGAKVKYDELLPRWDRKPQQDWRQMLMVAEAITRQAGGTIEGRS